MDHHTGLREGCVRKRQGKRWPNRCEFTEGCPVYQNLDRRWTLFPYRPLSPFNLHSPSPLRRRQNPQRRRRRQNPSFLRLDAAISLHLWLTTPRRTSIPYLTFFFFSLARQPFYQCINFFQLANLVELISLVSILNISSLPLFPLSFVPVTMIVMVVVFWFGLDELHKAKPVLLDATHRPAWFLTTILDALSCSSWSPSSSALGYCRPHARSFFSCVLAKSVCDHCRSLSLLFLSYYHA